ncbi:hypothetical protein PILCRDRAFT_815946 [Piloderma croceum F 1598]|uniref:Uncharacterized protein n=1 Tax=Piloderma croceum (strain F 1598) TaxID=765440 RepID=A0A0C3G7R8_PILCF|nr:hypothetical protein PILCRDRAFT_815946 [Piloderma croceum F 1598]
MCEDVYESKILINYDGSYISILPRCLIHSLPDIRRAHSRVTLPVRTSTTIMEYRFVALC